MQRYFAVAAPDGAYHVAVIWMRGGFYPGLDEPAPPTLMVVDTLPNLDAAQARATQLNRDTRAA